MPVTPITILSSQWTTAGVWIAAISLVGILIRQITPWRKQANDAAVELRNTLIARVEKLEAALERQNRRHDAERALSNHQLRNITACFDAMLLMLEMNPDRGPEIVEKIKKMRADQMLAEAEEKAIIRAAMFSDLALEEPEAANVHQ